MFRLSLWDPSCAKEEGQFSEVSHEGPVEAAFQALQATVNSGKARYGQVLAEDGLVLKNYARAVN
jgi:hypothetical protein